MHMTRGFVIALGAAAVWACAHDDPATVIVRDGAEAIAIIDLTTGGAGGFPGGTRVTNTFLLSGFDTAQVDAFARATVNPPDYRMNSAINCGFWTTPLIYPPGAAAVANYTAPARYLPAITGTARIIDISGCGTAVDYIVEGGNPGNGFDAWEVWHEFDGLGPTGTRYVEGFVRYALQQRGALDVAELLQTGAVTQPDSLVFLAGDFNPAGRKARDAYVTCASASVVRPTDGANPQLLGSDTSRSGRVVLDQTACSDATSIWTSGWNSARAPVPQNNNTAFKPNQYNFFVVWEALPDSTPNYAKPIYRYQMGPLLTTTGRVVNNGYGPIPKAALTASQLVLLPGGIGRADTVKFTANNLVPLQSGTTYQMWVVQAGTATAQRVNGRAIRLNGTTVVDTVPDTEFNLTSAMTGARVEFDFDTASAVAAYDQAVLAIGAAGTGSLPATQPMWALIIKPAGQAGAASVATTFGSFNSGTGTVRFAAAGSGTGGVFGLEVREDVKRLRRPALGYFYEAWLLHSSDPTARLSLGTLRAPYPDQNTLLTDADVMTDLPLSGAELTRAAVRYVAGNYGEFCEIASIAGTPPDTTVAAKYDLLQVRLTPKTAVPGTLSPTIVLSGGAALPPGANTHKSECTP
ncbi:MAG: hypothetical protein HYS40_01975 [Gemmatimonadetes bacterium]|nr:hypothetical protein [Gemmatimonadota bacterium]